MEGKSKLRNTAHRTGELAGITAATAFVDPTGMSLVATVGLGTVSLTLETCHLIRRGIHKGIHKHKERKAARMTIILNPQLMTEYEACVRKIAACTVGVSISSIMTCGIPHYSVGVAYNSGELAIQLRKLKKLREQNVHVMVSGLSKGQEIARGVMMKLFISLLFLGHDFDAMMDLTFGPAQEKTLYYTAFDPTSAPVVDHDHVETVREMHDKWLEHSIVAGFTDGIEKPVNELQECLGLPDDWVKHETELAGYHSPTTNIIAVGTVAQLTEVVAGKVLDEPVHEGLDRLNGKRNFRRRLETLSLSGRSSRIVA